MTLEKRVLKETRRNQLEENSLSGGVNNSRSKTGGLRKMNLEKENIFLLILKTSLINQGDYLEAVEGGGSGEGRIAGLERRDVTQRSGAQGARRGKVPLKWRRKRSRDYALITARFTKG